MALNPFFLQGSQSEQALVQSLINEQLKIYGVEVTYIPRKIIGSDNIIKEISSSRFDDNYTIEAYINNYEGYGGSGDILTKFGVSLRDELSLVISKERFEDFISPFLDALPNDEVEVAMRPREGDLIYFPLGQRIFEIKFVEHEQPFYQLGKTYVYELKCELFEYEDEVIDTSIDEIDTQLEEIGYINTLRLVGAGRTATAIAAISEGGVRDIFINNDGYGYKTTPSVIFSQPPIGGIRAQGVAITTSKSGVYSIKEILLTNAGAGYTVPPSITITGDLGVGAAATCSINADSNGVYLVSVVDSGLGYVNPPSVSIVGAASSMSAAKSTLNNSGSVSGIRLVRGGSGYSSDPVVVISGPPSISGIGTFIPNETIVGSTSGTTAIVKSWDVDTGVMKISINSGRFISGETIVGAASSAYYTVSIHEEEDIYDKYSQNDEIEEESDSILDFSEDNPFGNY